MSRPRFHLAFPVSDLGEARSFFGGLLGCDEGRSAPRWVDFDFFGHQLVAHLVNAKDHPAATNNVVDGHAVPASHFGVILDWQVFEGFALKLKQSKVDFVIDPYLRFKGQRGEQDTLFIRDPSNNYLEFKAFRNIDMLFDKDIDNA